MLFRYLYFCCIFTYSISWLSTFVYTWWYILVSVDIKHLCVQMYWEIDGWLPRDSWWRHWEAICSPRKCMWWAGVKPAVLQCGTAVFQILRPLSASTLDVYIKLYLYLYIYICIIYYIFPSSFWGFYICWIAVAVVDTCYIHIYIYIYMYLYYIYIYRERKRKRKGEKERVLRHVWKHWSTACW